MGHFFVRTAERTCMSRFVPMKHACQHSGFVGRAIYDRPKLRPSVSLQPQAETTAHLQNERTALEHKEWPLFRFTRVSASVRVPVRCPPVPRPRIARRDRQ
jgi:hypothetical protein